MQKLKTFIFPTTRAIRRELLSYEKMTLFLPNFITISEFLQRSCIVSGYKKIDSDTRTLMLLEASDFKEFEKLQLERNFFTFTKNSSYIFSLFTELAGEKKSLGDLELADTYGDYEEHIAILQTLYEKYETLCKKNRCYDPILLPKLYSLNEEYVKSLGDITLIVEGYLSAYELEVIENVSSITQLDITIQTSPFNSKMLEHFSKRDIRLESSNEYLIDFTCKSIKEIKPLKTQVKIESIGFSEQILQVGFVKQKIYQYLNQGLRHEEIVVIVPNESFANLLRTYDVERNFNFAMGKEFTQTHGYNYLSSVCEYIENPTVQNGARVSRYAGELYEKLSPLYYKNMKEIDFQALMQEYISSLHVRAQKEIIQEELYAFLKLRPIYEEFNLKAVLHLFMQRLAKRSLDDVGGGKITVMGVLESRYMEYKGVIIVDFNDSNVPKKSEKDLFLNSDIRGLAGLPTQHDRESLQKHYYWLLINRAKYVSISFVHSSSAVASRFLTELGIKSKIAENEQDYAKILYKQNQPQKELEEKVIALEYDFTRVKLSATSLKSYLECKRKYYYRYILSLKRHEMPQDFPAEYKIGLDIHEALKRVYEKSKSFSSEKLLAKSIEKEMKIVSGASSFEEYQLKLWSKKLQNFITKELERFSEGYEVKVCEQELTCEVPLGSNFAGMQLSGKIDRIDIYKERLYVLDYKSGKYPSYSLKTVEKATDFQLEFYYLLASTLGEVAECAYYDLAQGEVVKEELLQEKLELLMGHFKEMQQSGVIDFKKTEELGSCQYCEYATLCGRDDV
jgi:RecB family exonuclease